MGVFMSIDEHDPNGRWTGYVPVPPLAGPEGVRYAAWGGALLGGADDDAAAGFAAFGLALGLGFQVRDDALGVWGATAETGKAPADDIRRRKQSLPILLLRERASAAELAELDAISAAPEVDADGIARVLAMLARHRVNEEVAARVVAYHDEAGAALPEAARFGTNPYREALMGLVEMLAVRAG